MADGFKKTRGGIMVPSSFSTTYDAIRPSRKRRWLPTVTKDSREILTPSVLRMLRSHARNLYAQSGLVRGAFRDVSRYLIGHDGIRPQSMCADTGWARDVEARWQNWLKIADVRRLLHFNQIVRASSVEMDTDGDFGIILTETGGGNAEAPGMAQIQTIRSHRIEDAGTDNKSKAGVITDSKGRVIAYRVTEGDEGKYRDIPAESFVMLGDPELSDWVRYPSAIAHGINIAIDGREIMDAVTVGIKSRTSRAMVIKTPTGEADPDDYDQEEDVAGSLPNLALEELQSGEILRLGPGEEIQDISMDFPGGAVLPVMEFQYREFAMGYGTPLEVIYKSDLGGPAQRFFMTKFQRRVDERRSQVYIPHFYSRIWGFFVAKEMQRKAIPYREDWWKVRWQPTSANISIDVGREAQQNREDILLGTRTFEEDAGERGKDWEELRDQSEREADDLIMRAKRLAEKHDVSFEIALSMLSRRTPNGNLPTAPVQSVATEPLKN